MDLETRVGLSIIPPSILLPPVLIRHLEVRWGKEVNLDNRQTRLPLGDKEFLVHEIDKNQFDLNKNYKNLKR